MSEIWNYKIYLKDILALIGVFLLAWFTEKSFMYLYRLERYPLCKISFFKGRVPWTMKDFEKFYKNM